MLAAPWWMLTRSSWSVLVLAGVMTLVAFLPGPEQKRRMRGAFLWLVVTVLASFAVIGIALP
jgi:hypothetical protein